MVSIEMLETKIANLEKENSLLRGHVHRLDSKQVELISRIAVLENGYNGLADNLTRLTSVFERYVENTENHMLSIVDLVAEV